MAVNRFPLWCNNGQYLSSGIPLFPSVNYSQAGIFPQIPDRSLLTIYSAIRHSLLWTRARHEVLSARVRRLKIPGLM